MSLPPPWLLLLVTTPPWPAWWRTWGEKVGGRRMERWAYRHASRLLSPYIQPVGMNPGKYFLAYLDTAGDFSLTISRVDLRHDDGDWECQVPPTSFTTQDALASERDRLTVQGSFYTGSIDLTFICFSGSIFYCNPNYISSIPRYYRRRRCAYSYGGQTREHHLWDEKQQLCPFYLLAAGGQVAAIQPADLLYWGGWHRTLKMEKCCCFIPQFQQLRCWKAACLKERNLVMLDIMCKIGPKNNTFVIIKIVCRQAYSYHCQSRLSSFGGWSGVCEFHLQGPIKPSC